MFGDDYGVLVREDSFGYFRNDASPYGEVIRRFTLENDNKMTVEVITYGATITSIKVPDKNGDVVDVVLGFDKISGYCTSPHYFGCTVGRVSNRIANGKFSIEDKQYQVSLNNGKHHLHGGFQGYDKVLWDSHVEGRSLILTYKSSNGEEGYPGDVLNHVTYGLTDENELIIEYKSTANQLTPISLTNHSYFNLAGHKSGSIKNHHVTISANLYTPSDDDFIPTGLLVPVEGTPFDFTSSSKMSEKLDLMSCGFDHNFCVNGYSGLDEPVTVASITEPDSGRIMEVSTSQPGVHFYTANFLPEDDSLKGKDHAIYNKFGAMCFETQSYPDSINQSNFPKSVIGPGDTYQHTTVYKFSTVSNEESP